MSAANDDALPGDMPIPELKEEGYRVIDWITDYLAGVGERPVLARVAPGQVADSLPLEAPEQPTRMEAILADLSTAILPGITHWNHPAFFAYFATTGSGPGVLAEALCAALNVNAMVWRSSPAATELEERTLEWLRQMLGLPEGLRGHIQDTASTSTLVALMAAREAAGLDVRDRGLSGRELPPLRIYCSEEAHSSVEKAGIVLGIGREGVRRIPTDERFRMRVDELAASIAEDRAAGRRPIAVVATIGTTSTTSIDPLPEIGTLCRRERVWLHVDAAYGGSAAVIPEMRGVLEGVELADSIVVNPHKWLFVPMDCSALFFRDPSIARSALSLVPEYLKTPEGETVTNLMDYGPALGRRFRALKLWMVLRYFGRAGLAERLREHLRLARELAQWVDEHPQWERMAPVPFSTVCFRHDPGGLDDEEVDLLNERILTEVNASGEAFLSHTRLRGRFVLRLAIGNLRTTEAHVRRAWELLRAAVAGPAAM
jgi:aromatic-L-amino-acid decarboxylase